MLFKRSLHTSPLKRTLWSFMDHDDSVYKYASLYSQPEPQFLSNIRFAALKSNQQEAQKMISPLQGAFMSCLIQAQKPRSILELGCYIGYSALWMAFGQRNINDAYLWTCEKDARVAQTAINNISASGFKDKVSVIVDSADTVLSEWDVNNKLDLIFMDANKSAYKRYYDIIMDRELLHSHGQIIVDNVLFHGKVHPHTSQTTQGKSGIAAKLHEFNKHVASDTRSSQVILPLFDGLMLISKA